MSNRTTNVITAEQAMAHGITARMLLACAKGNERRGERRQAQADELRRVAAQLAADGKREAA